MKGQGLEQILGQNMGAVTIVKQYTNTDNCIRTTFHPESDYYSFVGSYKPSTQLITDSTGLTKSEITYSFTPQAFLKAYINAWKLLFAANSIADADAEFLVIEEINRGNCALIFGDLFQLLDRNEYGFSDYPINTDLDMSKYIEQSFSKLDVNDTSEIASIVGENIIKDVLSGNKLVLPRNFYIYATMNTSDQSLFPIDSAFKRRWDWKYIPIINANKGYYISVNGKKYDWWLFLEKINKIIAVTTNSEDKKLGYFFCKANEQEISAEIFVEKVIFYLWNDVFKDYEFADEIFNDTDSEKLTFDKFYSYNQITNQSNINEGKIEIFLNNLELTSIEDNTI